MVASKTRRSVLSDAMLGPNAQRVSQAPLTAVFCADTEYSQEIPRLQQLYRDTSNAPTEYVEKSLPPMVKLLSMGFPQPLQALLSPLAKAVCARTFVGPRSFVCAAGVLDSKYCTGQTYDATSRQCRMVTRTFMRMYVIIVFLRSYKQTSFAADHYMLAATSLGLGTSAMEGFDERRVRAALDIPSRYSIPVVIATGYPDMEQRESARFKLSDTCFVDKFGDRFEESTDDAKTS